MELTYIAHSERCALLLDAEGICRWVVPKLDAPDATVAAARRCVGAQFVATLDHDAPGLLGHEPRIGTNLLFALVTDGRVSLARFGPLQAFEKLDPPDVAPSTTSDAHGAAADAKLGTSRVTHLDAKDAEDALPPTVADVPDVDDLIRSLESVPDVIAAADTAATDTAVVDVVPTCDRATHLSEVASATTVADAAAADLPLVASADEVVEARLVVEAPAARDTSDDIETVAGPPDEHPPLPSLDVQEEGTVRSALDELDELVAKRATAPQNTMDSGERSIARVVALTAPAAEGPDDAELDVITTAFARSDQLAILLEAAVELDLDDLEPDADSSAPASSRGDDDPLLAETERVARPSGFVVKQGSQSAAPADASLATDDETRRFSRAAGHLSFAELEAQAASPRRGMLPRG